MKSITPAYYLTATPDVAAIEARIKDLVRSAVLARDTSIYAAVDADDNVIPGCWQLSVARWRENARTLNAEGRAELAAEEAAERELVELASALGTVAKDCDGAGNGCTITGYTITAA